MSADLVRAARELAAGSQAYARGDYGAAVQAYDAATEAGADSGDAWFDLGDACYRAGQHGRAALAWERALRRDPRDDAARANLQLVRSQSADAAIMGKASPLAELGSRVDPDLAAAALLGTFTLACAALVLRRRLRGDAARALLAVAGAALLLVASLAGATTFLSERARDPALAVVIADVVPVRTAPHDDAAVAFELHGGARVRVARTVGVFDEVHLQSGLSGFALAKDVEQVGP